MSHTCSIIYAMIILMILLIFLMRYEIQVAEANKLFKIKHKNKYTLPDTFEIFQQAEDLIF